MKGHEGWEEVYLIGTRNARTAGWAHEWCLCRDDHGDFVIAFTDGEGPPQPIEKGLFETLLQRIPYFGIQRDDFRPAPKLDAEGVASFEDALERFLP